MSAGKTFFPIVSREAATPDNVTCLTDVMSHARLFCRNGSRIGCKPSPLRVQHKEPANLIHDPERLWSYMRGTGHSLGINMLAIGGTTNHLHSLISVPPTRLLAHVIRDLKSNSSRHLNEISRFAWQDGYAAISISPSMIGKVSEYVATQVEHHQRVSFEVEYRALMDRAGLNYDPRFLFG